MYAPQAAPRGYELTGPQDVVRLCLGLALSTLVAAGSAAAQAPHLSFPEPRVANFYRVVYSPDGKLLAAIGRVRSVSTVQVWEASTGRPIAALPIRKDCSATSLLAFTPDGKTLVSGSMGSGGNLPGAAAWGTGAIEVFDVKTLKSRNTFVLAQGRAADAVVALDNKTLIVARLNSPAALYDLTTGKELAVLKDHDKVKCVTLSKDGNRLATGSFDGTVCVWDLAKRQRLRKLDAPAGKAVVCLALSPDGKWLAASEGTSRLFLWDLQTGKLVKDFSITWAMGGGRIKELIYTSDSNTLIVGGSGRAPVVFWDVKANKYRDFPPPPEAGWNATLESIALSPDGKWLAASGSGNHVWVWEVKAAQPFDWDGWSKRRDKRFEDLLKLRKPL